MKPHIFYTHNGSIIAAYATMHHYLEIEIDTDGGVDYFHSDLYANESWYHYGNPPPDHLITILISMLQDTPRLHMVHIMAAFEI